MGSRDKTNDENFSIRGSLPAAPARWMRSFWNIVIASQRTAKFPIDDASDQWLYLKRLSYWEHSFHKLTSLSSDVSLGTASM
jgi:hypothetical protein